MGPSGSGKSTLLHCLAGILAPDAGTVLFEGRRIEGLSESERTRLRRTAFGFVFQFGQLVPELSAVENVALPLLLNNVRRSVAEARAAAWFPRLGLEGMERRRPGEMSGGQAQRVAVARALVTEPSVVFADEPTGSLDTIAGEQVMELLTTAAVEQNTSVLLVTHEARVAAYAGREIVVRDGRVSGADRAGGTAGGAARCRRNAPDRRSGAVIRLGLRLALSDGRRSAIAVALTATAVAMGTAILLFAISFQPALSDRDSRQAWRQPLWVDHDQTRLLMAEFDDRFSGQPLVRILLAPLTKDAPTPPGIPQLPGAGDAYVSPALADLLARTPADQLAPRIGRVVGTIGPEALRSPQELVAVIGVSSEQLKGYAGGWGAPIAEFRTESLPPDLPPIAIMILVLAVVGALVPVAVFVATATRMAAARREQRLAALRLVGATPAQVARLAVVEALLHTVIGAPAGVILFFLARPLVAQIPLDGAAWWPDSIDPPLGQALALLVVVQIVGAAAALVGMRRLSISPLGVQQRVTPPPPKAWRIVPTLAGVVVLMADVIIYRGSSSPEPIAVMGASFALIIGGIAFAGPWLTVVVGQNPGGSLAGPALCWPRAAWPTTRAARSARSRA